ncbi:MAG TPA: nuclear transport factor 2 family protein [Thermoanaerobaculia bacterium]
MNGMRRILLATVLGVCAAGAAPAQAPAAAPPGDAAAQEARAQVEKVMGAFAAMDLEALKAGVTEDVTAFEMDLEGKPVRLGSRADVLRFAEQIFAGMKKMGASMKLDFHASDCRAGSTLAYCTVEFDFKAAMPDGSTMVQPSRNTVVLRKDDGGWKWAHWHSSLAVAPTPPAP